MIKLFDKEEFVEEVFETYIVIYTIKYEVQSTQ